MRIGDLRFQIGAFLLLALVLAPSAAQGMKQLTPDTGCVRHYNTLYWTADGGNQWSGITPIPPGVVRGVVRIEGVFFLDTQQGWAVISYPERIVRSTAETVNIEGRRYEIAPTVTRGQTWSFTPLTYPELPKWIQDTFAGPVSMYFVDSLHGWLNIAFAGNAKPSGILGADDGGHSWEWAGKPIVAGQLRFTSTQDGWVAGGMDYKSYSTRDGCKTWHEVVLAPPGEVGAGMEPTYEVPPEFPNPRHGFTAVYYTGPPGIRGMLVVYSTSDGGTTWKPAKIVRAAEETGAGAVILFTITDSVLVVSTAASDKRVTVMKVPLAGSLDSGVEFTTRCAPKLSFADRSNVWALTIGGHLLGTDDGGATWKDVRPWHVYRTPPAATPPAPRRPSPGSESRLGSTSG